MFHIAHSAGGVTRFGEIPVMIRAETFPALHFGPSTKEPLIKAAAAPRRGSCGGGRGEAEVEWQRQRRSGGATLCACILEPFLVYFLGVLGVLTIPDRELTGIGSTRPQRCS